MSIGASQGRRWDAQNVRNSSIGAFREALAALEPRDRTVLRLYLVEGVGSATIGTMYGVHRATVARWVSDAREAVFAGTRKRMMKDLDLGSATFASLMGKVATQLEVTLTSFLDEGT